MDDHILLEFHISVLDCLYFRAGILLYIVEMSYFGLRIYYIMWNDILVLQFAFLMLSCCWNVIALLEIVWNDILC